jgi:CarboxypepD_reg-like domain
MTLLGNFLYGQTVISGTVKDSINKPVIYANVFIQAVNSSVIKSFTHTDKQGNYEINFEGVGDFEMNFTALSYRSKKILISIEKGVKKTQNVVLSYEAIELNEVFVVERRPITIKKDTIVFDAKAFKQGNEQVIEDLLKKIPGLSVSNDGVIKVGNQEVEKVMVDGEDFFESGYKILTKNMPVAPVDKIEILKRYSNNKHLKGIEQSDKVALNLKLNDNFKRQWFGNLNLGYGIAAENRYDVQSNLMNFGKKNKYYFLTNLNNTGNDATGDIAHFIKPFSSDGISSIGDNQSTNTLIDLSVTTPHFEKKRTNFNNAKLLSLNSIFNPSERLKIKLILFAHWDQNSFFRNSTALFAVNGANFTNKENYQLRNTISTGFGKIDIGYDFSKTKTLSFITKYNNSGQQGSTELDFNHVFTLENLATQNQFFDQKISYTNKFKENKVLLLTGRYINEQSPQRYSSNQFFFQSLFPDSKNVDKVQQISENKMQFVGVDAHILDRKKNNNLFEIQAGNEYRLDNLFSTFALQGDTIQPIVFSGYQNNTSFVASDLYLKSKYQLHLKTLSLTGKIEGHQLFNTLINKEIKQNQSPFFINPSLGFNWEINDKNEITGSYSVSKTNTQIIDVYSDFILTSSRSFLKGTGNFNQLEASTVLLNYKLGNWSDKFFANTFVLYTKNNDFFSTNTLLSQNFSRAEKILIKGREFLSISSNFDRYFGAISSNLKVEIGYSQANYKNIVNNSDLREVFSTNYRYGLELRSGFAGIFNYHIGTKWTNTVIKTVFSNSFTDNLSFLDVSFALNNKFNLNLQSERYFFGNIDKANSTYYFLDIESRLILKPNKLSFSVLGKNLFDTDRFSSFSISDIGSSTTQYKILPRYILLKMEYRF